jgi:hypothetical protein
LVDIAGFKIDSQNKDETKKFIWMLQAVTEELKKIIPLSNDEGV